MQLNLIPLGLQPGQKPASIFVAGTVQPNINFRGNCFGVSNSAFVNTFAHSGAISVGYSTNRFMVSIFGRRNFTEIFNRDNIFEYDNHDRRNNYERLERMLENRPMFGVSFIWIHGSFGQTTTSSQNNR